MVGWMAGWVASWLIRALGFGILETWAGTELAAWLGEWLASVAGLCIFLVRLEVIWCLGWRAWQGFLDGAPLRATTFDAICTNGHFQFYRAS